MKERRFWICVFLLINILSVSFLSSAQENAESTKVKPVEYVDERIIEVNRWATKTLGGIIYDAKISDNAPDMIFTLSEAVLSAVSKSTGRIVWRKELPLKHGCFMTIYPEGDYVLVHSNKDVFAFNIKTGDMHSSINSPNHITAASIVSKKRDSIPFIIYSEKEGTTFSYQQGKKVAYTENKTYIAFGKDKNGDLFGVTQNPYALYKIDPETLSESLIKSGLDIKEVLDGKMRINSNLNSILLSFADKEKVYISAFAINYNGKVNEISNAKGRKTSELYSTTQTFGWKDNLSKINGLTESINIEESGDIQRGFEFEGNDQSYLIQTEDLTLNYISGSKLKIVWRRNEALGYISQFKFFDISERIDEKGVEFHHFMRNLESMDGDILKIPFKIITRLEHHITNFIKFFINIPNMMVEKLNDNDDVFERDEFGFKKLVVGITKTHDTLVGLQSNTGKLIWSLHLRKILSKLKLFLSHQDSIIFSNFHLIEKEDESEIVLVLSTKEGNSALIILDNDALVQQYHDKQVKQIKENQCGDCEQFGTCSIQCKGFVKSYKIFNGKILKTFKIHHAAMEEMVALVDSNKNTIIYPRDETEGSHNLFYYDIENSEDGTKIKGFYYDIKSCANKEDTRSCLSLSWVINQDKMCGQSSGQKLIAHSEKHSPEKSHFNVQKMANLNGSILFKYLEPSLFAIATSPIDCPGYENTVFVYVIEGSTGRIVHQFYEKNVLIDKPINLLLDENMLVFTFQRIGKFGEGIQQIQSVNFYEQTIKQSPKDVIVDYISGKNSQSTAGEMPTVIQQAYVFQHAIKKIGISRTLQGITGKDILLILENNQVYALKQQLISPRRPLDETMNESLDMDMSGNLQNKELPPYDAMVPYTPLSIVSHKHKLLGLNQIETAPSGMESTSLSISYGIDIIFSTVAPERQYDLLSQDFKETVCTVCCNFIGCEKHGHDHVSHSSICKLINHKGMYLMLTCIALLILVKLSSWYFNRKRIMLGMH